MCRLKHTVYLGVDATSHNPSPRRMCSCRYATKAKTPCDTSLETAKDNSKIYILYLSLKYLRTRKDSVYINEDADNAMWQDYVEKEFSVLVYCTIDLISSLLITNHQVIINIIDYTLFMTSSLT